MYYLIKDSNDADLTYILFAFIEGVPYYSTWANSVEEPIEEIIEGQMCIVPKGLTPQQFADANTGYNIIYEGESLSELRLYALLEN